MKKIILALLFFNMAAPATLFSQGIDSLLLIEEMQRLKQASDSLYREQLAKDSSYGDELDEYRRKTRQQEAEAVISEPLSKLEKKERARQRTLQIALLAMLGVLVLAAIMANRKKQNKRSSPGSRKR